MPGTTTREAAVSPERAHVLPDGRALTLGLTLCLRSPGDCCVAVDTSLDFAYRPALDEQIAVRFDDRLYDGIAAGFAMIDDPLPPEHLRVAIVALWSDLPLAQIVHTGDWGLIDQVGGWLSSLAQESTIAAWQ